MNNTASSGRRLRTAREQESFRDLQVLEEIAANASLTQRNLAGKLEIALGLTNLMLRRLITKGYVKAVNIQRNRLKYLLTPKGIAEKTKLTYQYLEYSLFLYRRVRAVLQETLRQVADTGGQRVVLFGTGEVAEVAYLTLKELGLTLVGVVDDQASSATFLGVPVLRSEALTRLSFDCGIMTTLRGGSSSLQSRMIRTAMPNSRLIVIEQQGAEIEAVLR